MVDNSIALQVKTPSFSIMEPLAAVQKLQMGEEMLNQQRRQGQAQGVEMNDALMRRALARAHDQQSWDEAMDDAARNGATDAASYKGRYSPLLALRLGEQYGAAPQAQARIASQQGGGAVAEGGDADPQFAEQWASATPDQRAATIKNLTRAQELISNVNSPESWDAAVDDMVKGGVKEAEGFRGRYGINGDQMARGMLQQIQKHLAYANQSAGEMGGMGGSARHPIATREVGGTLVNENLATGEFNYPQIGGERPQTTQDDWQYVGTDPEGKPLMVNRRTGAEKVGSTKVGAKPTATRAGFNDRLAMAQQIYPNDPEKAYAAAMGRLPMSQDQIVRSADVQAAKDLDSLMMTGQPPDNPDAWRKQRAEEYKQSWSAASTGPRAGAQPTNADSMIGNAVRRGVEGNLKPPTGARPAAAPGSRTPPQAAIDHLKANPALRDAFDKKYGPGASARVLPGGSGGPPDSSIDPNTGRPWADAATGAPLEPGDWNTNEAEFDRSGMNSGYGRTNTFEPVENRTVVPTTQAEREAATNNETSGDYAVGRSASGERLPNAYGRAQEMKAAREAERNAQIRTRVDDMGPVSDAAMVDQLRGPPPTLNGTSEPAPPRNSRDMASNRYFTEKGPGGMSLVDIEAQRKANSERLRRGGREFNRDASVLEDRLNANIRGAQSFQGPRGLYELKGMASQIEEVMPELRRRLGQDPTIRQVLDYLKSLRLPRQRGQTMEDPR